MEVYQGKSVFGGIAIGRISVHKKDEQQVKRVRIEDSEQEILRYRQAKQTAMEQLQGLYQKALKEVGEANAAIFEIHQMMLEDDDYNESVENIIRMQQVNAEYAVASTGDNFAQMFSAMDDDYMRARSADVKDISERVLSVLGGRATGIAASGEPVIIVADDLAPSETVQLNKDLVLSFVTVHGSVNSHTAILARTMSIPALIGTDVALDETVDGKFAVVDGTNGVLYVEPDEETLETMRRRQREEQEKKELLQTLKGRETVTLDGKKIRLYANIGNSKDLASVIQNDAAGIGLFRSEFLYLEKETFPTEEEQFQSRFLSSKGYTALEIVTYSMIFGALLLGFWSVQGFQQLAASDMSHILALVYLGAFPSAAAYFLWGKAMSFANRTSEVTNFMFVTPLLSTILGFLILREVPNMGTFLGGAYEYICSVFTEIVFGTVFWDYSDIPFNLGGRINLLYCFFWGFAAVAWFKIFYPPVSRLIEKIPVKIGKIITWLLIIFMLADGIVSSAALAY